MKPEYLENMRQNYMMHSLDENDVLASPFEQFNSWMKEAVDSGLYEPNAMSLATVGEDGKPSVRVVLLKGITEKGFIFFTNYNSRKGKELFINHSCTGLFLWGGLERQVRFEGVATTLLREESEAYFAKRPRESRISAIVSPQSQIVESKKWLEDQWEKINLLYPDENIPMPENWGGYEIDIEKIEFWQGRPGRFHDRILYIKDSLSNQWSIHRLAP